MTGITAITQGKLPATPPAATAIRMWLPIRLVRKISWGTLAFLMSSGLTWNRMG